MTQLVNIRPHGGGSGAQNYSEGIFAQIFGAYAEFGIIQGEFCTRSCINLVLPQILHQ